MPKHATDEQVVWMWNGYFWGLLVRHCESFEDGQKRAEETLNSGHPLIFRHKLIPTA